MAARKVGALMCHRQGSYGGGTTQKERRRSVLSVTATKPKRSLQEIPDWIIVDFDERGFRCERCGATTKHSTPTGVSRLESFALLGESFAIDHADCKAKA